MWRDGARQARLALMLRGVHEVPLDRARSRAVGELLAASGTDDIADAAVVESSNDGDVVVTGDVVAIARLADAAHKRVRVVPL